MRRSSTGVCRMATVLVFTGLPGSGKSTLAERVARTLGAPVFSGDWLMGALTPSGVLDHLDRPAYLDVYYGLLQTLMVRQVMLDQSAIVDCLVDGDRVTTWREIIAQHGANLVIVECACSDVALHRSRVEGRKRDIPGWHEVDWEHVERMRSDFPPLATADITVDSIDSVETNSSIVLSLLQ
ncbi:AAA family ATPase [Paractinoplanes tereljensis]|uniref:AAA family ATPase n=1 Tax=Paractinoplanes tereljensis TaxID=571912 RepID=UPI003398DF47